MKKSNNFMPTLLTVGISVIIIIIIGLITNNQTTTENQTSIVERYYQNITTGAPTQLVIASKAYQVSNGIWAYLAGPTGTNLNELKFFVTVFANTDTLAIGKPVTVTKFHGSDNYGYFFMK